MSITTITPSARDEKRAVMSEILASLTPDEQRCFVRYYSEGLHAAQAIEGTDLTESAFRLVRDNVRRRYHAAIREQVASFALGAQ